MDKEIYFKQIVPNPDHNPLDKNSRPNKWHYEVADRDIQVGDVVEFLHSGRGRGGHHHVHAKVTKINRATFNATELPRSYSPGQRWTLHRESPNRLYIDLSWKE